MALHYIEITTQPVNSTIVASHNITLTSLSSVDDASYSWHRANGRIPSRSVGQNSNVFTILMASPVDNGRYYCLVSKDGVSVESNRATITVNGKIQLVPLYLHMYICINLLMLKQILNHVIIVYSCWLVGTQSNS